jgi:D-alanyl-D-alanine carboxypeptidase (penicillin-binding protein 5/6)
VTPSASRAAATAVVVLLASLIALPAFGARGSGDVPPPTPVPIPGGGTSPSPFPTVLRTPAPSTSDPQVSARSVFLADLDTGQVLFEHAADVERPIASVTKIMTALLVLRRTDPSDVVTVSEKAVASQALGLSQLGLHAGERITVEQLLYAIMLQSANDAAVALAEHVAGSERAFVRAMNVTAAGLGMRHTRFLSPNGLDDRGYSTARDLATLTREAFEDPLFARVAATRFHEVPSPDGPPRVVQNRNALLWLYPGSIGGKTGYTAPAGFCVVAAAQREGVRLVAVVLGSPGEPFSAAATLLDHGFAAFDRREVVRADERYGTIAVQGRDVQVMSARDLEVLVPVDEDVSTRVRPKAGVLFPPVAGERVGTVAVRAGETRLGRAPLVPAVVPPPPEPEPGPWWARAAGAVVDAVSGFAGSLFG